MSHEQTTAVSQSLLRASEVWSENCKLMMNVVLPSIYRMVHSLPSKLSCNVLVWSSPGSYNCTEHVIVPRSGFIASGKLWLWWSPNSFSAWPPRALRCKTSLATVTTTLCTLSTELIVRSFFHVSVFLQICFEHIQWRSGTQRPPSLIVRSSKAL